MSPRPRVYKTEAIVLRTMELGEADRVLTVLTPRLGKLKVIAKGVRRPRSSGPKAPCAARSAPR